MKKIFACLCTLLLLFSISVAASAETIPAKPVTEQQFYVADNAGVLSEETKNAVLSQNRTLRSELGAEKKIGDGKVDFKALLTTLNSIGFNGNIIIEREISGEEQIKDILFAKQYFENILAAI